MGAWQGTEGFPPASWTKAIAALCKQLAPSQLTIAGDEGILKCVFLFRVLALWLMRSSFFLSLQP